MKYLYFVLIFFAIAVFPVYAYLDPGTGGMIVSAIIGALATVLYVFKGFFYKIIKMFRGDKKNPVSQDDKRNN